MGAYFYIKPRLETAMRELGESVGMHARPLRYVGRSASASVGEICSCCRCSCSRPHI
jgi:2-oxoglutarate dehydrogenase complex dehydrogenase (E1) component-like enzyme